VRPGNQLFEPLSASVQAALHKSVSDHATPFLAFDTEAQARHWLVAMSQRLAPGMPDRMQREEFLVTVHYEAKRAGLDPQMVLALIQVESNFRKYAVSSAGARGYMQVMPFWMKLIGNGDNNLFHLRTNLRYGCVILRHYLDRENGDLYRALGRYNGSLGQPEYPNAVLATMNRNWLYEAPPTPKLGLLPASYTAR
jgi:soluble lytic murein transglycosylase-like protein